MAVLIADAINAKEMDLDRADKIALFKEKHSKICLCVQITSNFIWLTVNNFDSSAGLNLIGTFPHLSELTGCTSYTLFLLNQRLRALCP